MAYRAKPGSVTWVIRNMPCAVFSPVMVQGQCERRNGWAPSPQHVSVQIRRLVKAGELVRLAYGTYAPRSSEAARDAAKGINPWAKPWKGRARPKKRKLVPGWLRELARCGSSAPARR